jgi:hypothetical protein
MAYQIQYKNLKKKNTKQGENTEKSKEIFLVSIAP